MTAGLRLVPALLALLLLAGCWDVKTIQDVDYFTGMGIDYREGKWTIFVQQLDFSKVAKSEGGKSDSPPMIWIGKGEGATLGAAAEQLYRTSQQRVFMGHLSAVVLSEGAAGSGALKDVLDALIRFREIRYTPWIYGTGDKMEEILSTIPFFNLTPLNSILHMPEDSFKQQSEIKPLRLSAFIRSLRDPGGTALLPSLHIDEKTWRLNGKPDPKLVIDGVYALRGDRCSAKLPAKELAGLHWITPESRQSILVLEKGGRAAGTINVLPEAPKLTLRVDGGKPRFALEMRAKAKISGINEPLRQEEIKAMAEEKIRREILALYAYGKSKKTDLLGLDHRLYRKNPRLWRAATTNGESADVASGLDAVRVSIRLTDASMYKLDRR